MSNEKEMVGIIYSPGFGAGWSTWNDGDCATDQELAKAIDAGEDFSVILDIAENNWPEAYTGGLKGCVVKWVEKGTAFRIDEYDGNESLVLNDDWSVA